jgi:hypothetical protein
MCVTLPCYEAPPPRMCAVVSLSSSVHVRRLLISITALVYLGASQKNSTAASVLYLSIMARVYVGGLRENITERELEDEVSCKNGPRLRSRLPSIQCPELHLASSEA